MSRSSIAGSKDHRRVQGAQGNATLSGPLPMLPRFHHEAKVCVIEWIQIGDMTREPRLHFMAYLRPIWEANHLGPISSIEHSNPGVLCVFAPNHRPKHLGQDYPCGRRSPRARYSATIKDPTSGRGGWILGKLRAGARNGRGPKRWSYGSRWCLARWPGSTGKRDVRKPSDAKMPNLGHSAPRPDSGMVLQLQKHFVLQEETWYWRSPVLRQSYLKDLGVDYGASPEQNNS